MMVWFILGVVVFAVVCFIADWCIEKMPIYAKDGFFMDKPVEPLIVLN